MQYSPSIMMGAARYNAHAGVCVSEPTPKDCGHHVLNQVPHHKVCNDVDAIEKTNGPITIDQLAPISHGARGRIGRRLRPAHNGTKTPGLSSRNLAVRGYGHGSFRIIRSNGRSSTGALGTHAILVPGTDQVCSYI